MPGQLTGKRVLILGAESVAGRAAAETLAAAGADLALVAAVGDPAAAFELKRVARGLPGSGRRQAQGADATNEMAVRVMVRQVGKQFVGLDAIVFAADLGDSTNDALDLALRLGVREIERSGGGTFVALIPEGIRSAGSVPHRVNIVVISLTSADMDDVAARVVHAVAGAPSSG